jgi:hypothetical protein
MTDSQQPKSYSLAQAHKYFAITYNQEAWQLLDKADRSREDDEKMIYAVHASCRHWLEAGGAVNHQRGEWMIARALAETGAGLAALRHAERCLELTRIHKEQVKDFDWAYAYEAVARAHLVLKHKSVARVFWQLAKEAGEKIADEEDKKHWNGDFDKLVI